MSDEPDWSKARHLNPIQMIAWAIEIAHWEAQERGELSEELADKLAIRADEIIVGLLNGNAIYKNPKTGQYEWLERPDKPKQEAVAATDVLVINPTKETK